MTAEEFLLMYKLSDDNPRAILKEIYRETILLAQAAKTISADVINTKMVVEGMMEKVRHFHTSTYAKKKTIFKNS